MRRPCNVLEMGLVDYDEAFLLQRAISSAREEGIVSDTLILLEHPPVITLGRRASRENLLASEETLRSGGVTLRETNRGGDVTYHGPGQLVGYPILGLRQLGLGVAAYVHTLEQTIVDLLAVYGLAARRDPGYIGVWVGDSKVAAIGVAVSHGITTHGFALNVDPNLSHFGLINPCGITERGVTSMARLLGTTISIEEVIPRFVTCFSSQFGVVTERTTLEHLASIGVRLPS